MFLHKGENGLPYMEIQSLRSPPPPMSHFQKKTVRIKSCREKPKKRIHRTPSIGLNDGGDSSHPPPPSTASLVGLASQSGQGKKLDSSCKREDTPRSGLFSPLVPSKIDIQGVCPFGESPMGENMGGPIFSHESPSLCHLIGLPGTHEVREWKDDIHARTNKNP